MERHRIFRHRAKRGGVGERCDDWLPGCDAVYATQLADDRFANPAIDASTGLPVTTFRDEDFVELAERIEPRVWTPYHGRDGGDAAARQRSRRRRDSRGDGASPPGRRHVVLRAVHQHRASPVATRRGVRRGERTQLSRRVRRATTTPWCPRGRDVDAVDGNLTVDGNGTLGGDCTPSDEGWDVATWYVGVLDGREVTKPGVRFTDAAGSVLSCRNPPSSPPTPTKRYKPDVPPSPCAGVTDDPRVGDGVCAIRRSTSRRVSTVGIAARRRARDACGTGGAGSSASIAASIPSRVTSPGAWATYNAAIAAAWTLAPAWKVELTLDAAAWESGTVSSRARCVACATAPTAIRSAPISIGCRTRRRKRMPRRDGQQSPGRGARGGDCHGYGAGRRVGGNRRHARVHRVGVPSTTPTCEIAGVATGAVRVDNDAGDADDPTAVNSTWHCDRPTLTETDPQLEPSFETNRRRSTRTTSTRAPRMRIGARQPCAVGVVVRWNLRFRDAAGLSSRRTPCNTRTPTSCASTTISRT